MDEKENPKRNYWKEEEENIIKQWSDKALCYQWMHTRCREILKKKMLGLLFRLLLFLQLQEQQILPKTDFQTILGIMQLSVLEHCPLWQALLLFHGENTTII